MLYCVINEVTLYKHGGGCLSMLLTNTTTLLTTAATRSDPKQIKVSYKEPTAQDNNRQYSWACCSLITGYNPHIIGVIRLVCISKLIGIYIWLEIWWEVIFSLI